MLALGLPSGENRSFGKTRRRRRLWRQQSARARPLFGGLNAPDSRRGPAKFSRNLCPVPLPQLPVAPCAWREPATRVIAYGLLRSVRANTTARRRGRNSPRCGMVARHQSLRVGFPAACGVSFMNERVSSQEPQRGGIVVPLGISGEVPSSCF